MDYPYASLGGVGYDVRHMIYSHVLLAIRPTLISISNPLGTPTDPDLGTTEGLIVDFGSTSRALFRVNKEISKESLQFFYLKNRFGDVETDGLELEESSHESNSKFSWQGRLPIRVFRPVRQPSRVAMFFMKAKNLISAWKQTSQDRTVGIVRYSELKMLSHLVNRFICELTDDDDTVELVHDTDHKIPFKAYNKLRVVKELMDSLESQRKQRGHLLIDHVSEQHIPGGSRKLSLKQEPPQTQHTIRAEELQEDRHLLSDEAFITIAKSLAVSEEPADWKRALAYLLLCCKMWGVENSITSPNFSFLANSSFAIGVELFHEITLICLKLGLRDKALLAAHAASNQLHKRSSHFHRKYYRMERTKTILVQLVDLLTAEKAWHEASAEVCYALHRYPDSEVLHNTLGVIKARQLEAEADEKRFSELEKKTIQLVNSYMSDGLWGIAINEVNCALAQHPLGDIEDLRLAASSKSKADKESRSDSSGKTSN
jgi:hypothetical protein